MTHFIEAFRDYANAPVKGVGGITFNAIIKKLGRAERKRTQLSVMQDEIILFKYTFAFGLMKATLLTCT